MNLPQLSVLCICEGGFDFLAKISRKNAGRRQLAHNICKGRKQIVFRLLESTENIRIDFVANIDDRLLA